MRTWLKLSIIISGIRDKSIISAILEGYVSERILTGILKWKGVIGKVDRRQY